jgi:thiol-disulfide isomerase/thioredoxin
MVYEPYSEGQRNSMREIFIQYTRTSKAEWLKQKHTGLLWFTFASAAFMPVIQTIAFFFIDFSTGKEGGNGLNLFILANIKLFTGFFFPLFLIVAVTRVVYMEHRSDTWKLLETQPSSRFFLFFSKWQLCSLTSLVCLLALFAFSVGGGLLLVNLKYSRNFTSNHVEWSKDMQLLVRLWVSSLGLISLQFVISLWLRNFAWPIIIGVISLIAGSIFSGFGILSWFPYSPVSLTSSFSEGSNSGSFFIPHELLSVAWAVLFFWLGYQWFRNKKFSSAYVKPFLRLLTSIAFLVVFALVFYFLNRPVQLKAYNKTVIAGKIHLGSPVEKLVFYKYPTFDTMMVVPVKNGMFHYVPEEKISKEIYIVRAGAEQAQLFFGSGDSVYMDWAEQPFRYSKCEIGGSRIAENSYLSQNRNDLSLNFLSNAARRYAPAEFYREVLDKWTDREKELNDFKTVDHIKPAPDFIELQKKLIAVDYLNLVHIEYPKTMAVYFPNDTIKEFRAMNDLESLVRFDDTTLIDFPAYREYVMTMIQRKAFKTGEPLLSVLANEVSSSKVRNSLAFEAIVNDLSVLHDSSRRANRLAESLTFLDDERLRNKLIDVNERLNRLQVGKKAPGFSVENLNGKQLTLNDLTNRYLVIDLWATWCGPCRMESPYFEKIAEEYTDESTAFVSISIDEDKNAWKTEALQKSKHVLQLWASNPRADFINGYSIAFIPRFMLIDPKGNIVSVDLPRPSDPRFEKTLQNAIPSLRLTSY